MSLIQKILVKSNAFRLVSCRICNRNYATDKGTTVGVSPGKNLNNEHNLTLTG